MFNDTLLEKSSPSGVTASIGSFQDADLFPTDS
jgi:hypothetical protein